MSDTSSRVSGLSASEKRDLLTRLLAKKARAEVGAPLSYAQQRLWFLDQLAPGSAFYNMPIALRLRMRLDVSALARTLNEIVARHEVLRTRFATRDGRPVQVIAPHLWVDVCETDLQHLPATERESEAQRLATAESRKPFELTRGPLIRAGLLRLAPQDCVLLLTLHHIIADGWSLVVLFREISALYAAFAEGRPSPLPALPIQFADYAAWQRRWLEGPVLQQQLAYWVRQLAGLPELVLPTDRPRPAIATFRGARRFFEIAEDILRRLEALGRQTGTTLFMVLLAAFQVLMGRYSGQEEFPIGAPIGNRTREETEGLIGFFVNTLVLRADLSGGPTFRALLARVRETALAAYAHQDLPFDRLVEELHPVRDAARTPLIQVMFALQNIPGTPAGIGDSPIEMVQVERGTANFDLVLDLWQQDRGLGGRIEYSTDLFDAQTIERLLDHFRVLIAAAAASPEEPIAALPLMTAAEYHRVAAAWNATASDYPAATPLSSLFEAQSSATPRATALQFGDESLTYGEANARANQLAHHLRAAAFVRPGDFVAVHLERSADLILVLLGILKAGAAYVPLDVSYPEARLATMIGDSRPRAIVSTRPLAASLPDFDGTLVLLDEHAAAIRQASTDNLPATRAGDDPAYVMYTSGSTGTPRGIVIPQRAVSRLVRNTNYIEIKPADRIAQASNVSFDASTFEIWGALLNGARLVGVPKEVSLSPEGLAVFLRDHHITTLFLTTALFNQVASACPEAFRSLKHLLFGGEAVDPRWVREVLARGAPKRLLHVYGPTECTTFATWHLVERVPAAATTVPIGRPVSNTTAYVLDPHGQPVPPGVAGELHLGGPGLALEYLGRPERTAESFVSSPFGCLYRTGDLVRLGADLTLAFLGRRDSQVKVRGHRVELGEIEVTLLQHPSVRDAKVVVREGNGGDRRLAAYLVVDPTSSADGAGPPTDDRICEWQHIFDEIIYDGVQDGPIARREPLFNITGWTSSYTGQPISPEEMREQVDQTVERIMALAPEDVLEIGCGTGLLLFRVAPATRRYVATDFSHPALDYVARQLAAGGGGPVRLLARRADDFSGLEDQRFDLVVLNSVVQYFPHADYLLEVLTGAVSVLKPGGTIFVGDVRNLSMLEAFHTAVGLHRAPRNLPITELRARVRRQVAEERELVVAPQFFPALAAELPPITDVGIQPKRGRRHNELTQFRYDITLRTGPARVVAPVPAARDWCRHDLSIQKLRHELLASRPDLLCIERVPNARTVRAVEAARRLDDDGFATAGDLRHAVDRTAREGVDPEDVWAMSDDVPYTVEISWARGWPDGAYDVVFRRVGTTGTWAGWSPHGARGTWSAFTNRPQQAADGQQLIPQVRAFLQRRLPEYMLPAAFVVLDRLPLTPNGKVDVQALPAPDIDRPVLSSSYVAPGTALERVLAGHWASVLGLERVGVMDSFFELGGHSLLATQLAARITATLGVPLTLRTLFSKPTVAGLAAALLAQTDPEQRLERVAALVLAVAELPEEEAAALLAARAPGLRTRSGA
jgi:amino acid adenylation domain-containing protein